MKGQHVPWMEDQMSKIQIEKDFEGAGLPSMISQAKTTRKNSIVDALIGAEPQDNILMLPPRTACT